VSKHAEISMLVKERLPDLLHEPREIKHKIDASVS
jgi:hypothetical protein